MVTHFDFAAFPVLTTNRLTLRRVELSDAADVLAFRGDRYVQRYNGPVYHDVEDVRSLIADLQAEYDAHEGITWGVTLTPDDRVIGLFGFHDWNTYHCRAEVGYDLALAYWGQGIASETLRAMLTFGFQRMNLHRIYARTIVDNTASIRLLERLGFSREGTRREHALEEDGTFHDSAVYGLLRREYRNLQ